MKLEEFVIGEFFWTGSGKWKCFDKGTKTVVALKWETVLKEYTVSWYDFYGTRNEKKEHRVVNPNDVHWTEIDSTILFDYDFDGCWATEEEYKEIMEINNG